MGLKINTNIAGLRTTRILRGSTLALNRSLERLSSGLRVNRAADDAAGLAIAEGFRSVSRAAQVAQRNAQDGIGLVQTAEGALSETINYSAAHSRASRSVCQRNIQRYSESRGSRSRSPAALSPNRRHCHFHRN